MSTMSSALAYLLPAIGRILTNMVVLSSATEMRKRRLGVVMHPRSFSCWAQQELIRRWLQVHIVDYSGTSAYEVRQGLLLVGWSTGSCQSGPRGEKKYWTSTFKFKPSMSLSTFFTVQLSFFFLIATLSHWSKQCIDLDSGAGSLPTLDRHWTVLQAGT